MQTDIQNTIRGLVTEFASNMEAGDLDAGETNLRSINTHLDYVESR